MRFSPNGQKLAYTSHGKTYTSASAIFIIDIKNNITTKITEGKNRTYYIKGWLGNEDGDLISYYFH
jgi:Tol biopolymer transport system component